ncbi:pyridoxal phosphate-dependent aminotransferase [Neotabrizicola shimadae]|uniref:Pyridoxal phosphate-dependent aminotransferase n=1 Tax=Neotabrizicola shimadae TaxID=2807096 RepID=A0A8G1EF99_9RHOB|nr:pyridoxal phosphate-dependent aminotransferase [Neotabrizicola shimadae]QYZ71759.1 pyridoxal phosphate-dependent aminotransferase [Neotabrizicola shimadae]
MTRFLTPLAQGLPATVPFTGPETLERTRGRPFRARLGANESLFGPSPRAVEAMAQAAAEAWMYGDPDQHDLKAAIAAHHGIAPGHIVPGEGIDGLLGLLVRLTVAPGDRVVTSAGAYPTFAFHVTGHGGTLTRVPYLGNHEDPQALLDAAHATGAKLLYLSNPDNPMGSHHPAEVIEAMLDLLPATCLLVLDEAYIDLAPAGTAPRIAPDDPRVIRFRTFSKGYGLAGLRMGYALAAEPLARAFDRVRNHFGLGRIAQAGAIAALNDQGWLAHVRGQVEHAKLRIARIARANGLEPLPSATNFVTIDCGRGGAFARAVLTALQDRDVFVRMPGIAPLDRCIRISAGDAAALAVLEEALPAALAAARG